MPRGFMLSKIKKVAIIFFLLITPHYAHDAYKNLKYFTMEILPIS